MQALNDKMGELHLALCFNELNLTSHETLILIEGRA